MNRLSVVNSPIHAAIIPLILASNPCAAEDFEPTWQLALDLALVEPSNDSIAVGVTQTGLDVDFDTRFGAGLRLEYQFSKALALELGVLGASGFGVTIDTAEVATRIDSFAPVTLGLNYHFDTASRIDLYAGPFLAAVNYGDIEVATGPGGATRTESTDTDFGWGAIAGLDLPLGSGNWSLQANVRYIRTGIEAEPDEGPVESDFNPLIFSIGFGYRF